MDTPKKKRLNIPVDESLHTQLKVMSAQNGQTIIDYVTAAIREKIKGDEKKGAK